MPKLIKDGNKTEYITMLGDGDGKADADIRLTSLYNINASKWDNE